MTPIITNYRGTLLISIPSKILIAPLVIAQRKSPNLHMARTHCYRIQKSMYKPLKTQQC